VTTSGILRVAQTAMNQHRGMPSTSLLICLVRRPVGRMKPFSDRRLGGRAVVQKPRAPAALLSGQGARHQRRLLFAGIVRWIDVGNRKRSLAVNLDDGFTGAPSIVVHLCRGFGKAAYT
jgi:hypothetical protein